MRQVETRRAENERLISENESLKEVRLVRKQSKEPLVKFSLADQRFTASG